MKQLEMTDEEQTPHWFILGAGAIGSLWSAYWAANNVTNTAITRGPSEKKHISLITPTTHTQFIQNRININEANTRIRHLLITTKAHHCLAAIDSVKHLLADDAVIIVLQNGMMIKNINLSKQQQLYAATTTDGAHFKSPHELIHAGYGTTHIGIVNHDNEQVTNLDFKQLPKTLSISQCHNIEPMLWKKLAVNCAINALGVKYKCKNGELIDNETIRKELALVCEEIAQVVKAYQPNESTSSLYDDVVNIAKLTSDNINSTLQDIYRGKTTEIQALTGYLCLAAKTKNIATPLNDALLANVLEHEKNINPSSQ